MAHQNFMDVSEEIAAEFLQTVVVIDDHASFGGSQPTPSGVGAPGRGAGSEESIKPPDSGNTVPSHHLDAGQTIDHFALKGIVCSLLKPAQGIEKFEKTLKNLVRNTDLFLLDWSINKDNGTFIKKVIDFILSQHQEKPGQLLLITVYTGELDLKRVLSEIQDCIKPATLVCDDFTLQLDGARIVIFAKPGTATVNSERILEYKDIPSRLTTEFAKMTSGLISNVALSALASVRKNAHKILNRFSSELDPAFLNHRIFLPNPDDANRFITGLVASEVQSVIEEEDTQPAGLENINLWLKSNPVDYTKFQNLIQEQIKLSLEDDVKKAKFGRPYKNGITTVFAKGGKSSKLDEQFSVLSALRTYYGTKPRKLSLGTIVEVTGSYLICLQPRCDTNGFEESRNFLFLPLNKVPQGSPFELVVLIKETYERLKVEKKSYDLKLIRFKPAQVESETESEGHFFFDAEKNKYRWIAELKGEHALRLADEFASTIGRVGLDEYEWLRRAK